MIVEKEEVKEAIEEIEEIVETEKETSKNALVLPAVEINHLLRVKVVEVANARTPKALEEDVGEPLISYLVEKSMSLEVSNKVYLY